MYILIIGLIVLVSFTYYEYLKNQKNRKSIPIIIHVNGTRGKSSVTRLIAAALRASGKKVIAKTTGSAPALIHEDGSESPVVRFHGANIKEQLKIIKYAAKEKADILVLECMAVTPEYQWVTEQRMVKSNIGVLTNTRLDHLDVMGPGLRNCTLSLCNTIPMNGKLFTAENRMLPLIRKVATERNTELVFSDGNSVSMDLMKGFSHIEHRDNVATALEIAKDFEVEESAALEEMYKAKPDIGAAEIFTLNKDGKKMFFVHSFAANDPESTEFLIDYVKKIHSKIDNVALVLNTRADRIFRSKQLIEMLPDLNFNELLLVGEIPGKIKAYALNAGISKNKIKALGWVSGDKVVESLMQTDSKEILIFGIGNIGGNGKELVNYFKTRNNKNV